MFAWVAAREGRVVRKLWRLGASLVLVVLFGTTASATTIQLSELSSDATPASQLSALLELNVSGNTLTVIVTNQTTSPNTFNINEIYFNASDDILGLNLTGATGQFDGNNKKAWTLVTAVGADSFGTFDFGLLDGVDSQPSTIFPGEFQTFNLHISCAASATCDMSDFGTELSTLGPGSNRVLAAMNFVSGPGGDSAYGASGASATPEPHSAILFGVGALVVGVALRKKAIA